MNLALLIVSCFVGINLGLTIACIITLLKLNKSELDKGRDQIGEADMH